MPQAGIRPRSGCRGHGTVWPIHRCRHRCRPRSGTRPLGKRQRCAREAAQNSAPNLASAPTLVSAPNLALRRPWPLRRPHVLIRGLASQTASQWLRASVGTARPARTDQAGPGRPRQAGCRVAHLHSYEKQR